MEMNHKATPEQWASVKQACEPIEMRPGVFVGDRNSTIAACLLELRARVEALEEQNWIAKMAPQRPDEGQLWVDPKGVTRERRGTSWVRVPGPPAPAGSLVERVANECAMTCTEDYEVQAGAVIRAVAAHIRANVSPGPSFAASVALWLEQEADR